MPPPVPQQGSRAGLITTLVIFVIFTIVFAVLFFDERGKRQKAETDATVAQNKDNGYLPDKLDSGDIKIAKDLASGQTAGGEGDAAAAGGYKSKTDTLAPTATNAFDLVDTELHAVIKAITPLAVTAKQAVDYQILSRKEAENIYNGVQHKTQVAFNENLGQLTKDLATACVTLDHQISDTEARLAAEQKATAAAKNDLVVAKQGYDAQLASLGGELAKQKELLAKLKQDYDAAIPPIHADYATKLKEAADQLPPLNARIEQLTKQVQAVDAYNRYLMSIYRQFRLDPSENTVRHPDGYITRIAEDGKSVYINLGSSDHLSAGMTFEIYDQHRGIPSLKDENPMMEDENVRHGRASAKAIAAASEKSAQAQMLIGRAQYVKFDTQMPVPNKGSLEVVQVGPGHSSLCRIIKLEPGVTLQQGDLIANLVYDPYIKPKVAVYGAFDLDYNGIADIKDADAIRRQVETWGGRPVTIKSVDDVLPELDYLVMGVRPKVPTLEATATAEEQANAQKMKDLQKVYDDISERARQFSIPVLNQTRFLYYTGYFDQRLR